MNQDLDCKQEFITKEKKEYYALGNNRNGSQGTKRTGRYKGQKVNQSARGKTSVYVPVCTCTHAFMKSITH